MRVEINIEGRIRTFESDFDTLHNNDWNEIIREMLDLEEYED